MITLFFIVLVSTALFFASVPVVLFALMMETCARRAAQVAAKLTRASTRRLAVSPAHVVSTQAA